MRQSPQPYRFRQGDIVEDATTAVQARVENWLNGPLLQARVIYNPAGLHDYPVGVLRVFNFCELVLVAKAEDSFGDSEGTD